MRAFNIALGEREAELEMYENTEATDTSSLLPISQALYEGHRRTVKVKVEGLDDFLCKAGLPLEPDILLKLDVQGYEDRVLRGATRTLAKAKACILEVLFDFEYVGQPSFETLTEQLRAFGYRYAGSLYQGYARDGHVTHADALFLR